MDGKLLITRLHTGEQEQIVSAFYENGKAVEISCTMASEKQLLGNIYIGKVKNILTNIEAAFVEIAGGVLCYYSLRENRHPIYIKEKKNQKLAQGDELLVQVSREAVGTKAPTVTCNLNFSGKYLVLTTEKKQLGLSSKLSAEEKHRLRLIAEPFLTEEFGVIVRTNAAGSLEEELREELKRLTEQYRSTVLYGKHQSCFSLIYRDPPGYAVGIRNLSKNCLSEIVTDDHEIYGVLQDYLTANQPEDLQKLRFYDKEQLGLDTLYGISRELENALRERIWMKSGAYLVIQPTEALTVIDVNTGKYVGHKKMRETFFKINCEAAAEIARQLRLRNLSGIIVADFIDMDEAEDRDRLMEFLGKELKKDPVKTVLVDMTPLGLVEITRKKVRKSLREQVRKARGFLLPGDKGLS
ncbi:MAG: ribonuclease E/G [Lachnospiraceae bacterium]|nr:ribonuclease E/G [Lachnospiraceae bacterium]